MKLLHSLRHLLGLGVVITFLSSVAAVADGHGDTVKITEVLRNYESSVNGSDAEAVGNLYTDDAILLPDRFDAFAGKEAITGFYAFAFSALTLDLEFAIDPDHIIVVGDTAYATTTSTGTRFIKQANQTVPEINRELWVFEKVEGEWKIARYAFNQSQ